MVAPDTAHFAIRGPFDSAGRPLQDSRVAPGTEVAYTIRFDPAEAADYAHDLVIVTEREKFIVPLRAVGPRAFLTLPDAVEFDSTPCRTGAARRFMVRNEGAADAVVRLQTRLPGGVRGECPFTVEPAVARVPAGGALQLTVRFVPPTSDEHEGELECVYLQEEGEDGEEDEADEDEDGDGGMGMGIGSIGPGLGPESKGKDDEDDEDDVGAPAVPRNPVAVVRLLGTGHDTDVVLSSSLLQFPDTYLQLASTATVRLTNRSEHPVRFSWRSMAHRGVEEEEKGRVRAALDDQRRSEARAVLADSVRGGGSAADGDLSEDDDEDGAAARGGGSALAETQASMGGALRPSLEARAQLQATERRHRTMRRQASEASLLFEDGAFRIEPLEGSVWAHSEQEFTVTFVPQNAGAHDITAFLQTQGREKRLPLVLRAAGVGPRAVLSFDQLDMGDITVTSVRRYEMQLFNKGEIPCEWSAAGSAGPFSNCFRVSPPSGRLRVGEQVDLELEFCSRQLGEVAETAIFQLAGSEDPVPLQLRGQVVPPAL